MLDLLNAAILGVLKSQKIGIDHAVEENVLKWEVDFHLDAMSQVVENLEWLDKLGDAVDESDVFTRLLATLKAIWWHKLEVVEAFLGFSIALSDILLQ